MIKRRSFLVGSLAAAASTTLGCASQPPTPPADPAGAAGAGAAPPPPTNQKKSLLILGGTGFVGPAVVEAARARGFAITLFNRGKTRPELFPDVEKLRGNRDPDKDEGLKALEGRSFDAVIDTSGYVPRIVRASAELLAKNVKQYIFISSISVYKDTSKPNMDETAAVGTIPDPTVETMGKEFENYGPLKALCEQAAEKAMPGRVANVRPGYIVGPGDGTDRFTYWPLRVAKGGEMLVPGTPNDPIQVIDVRDLAEWLVKLVADGTTGVFNATGPGAPLTMGGVIEASKKASPKSEVKLTWVPASWLKSKESGGGEPIDLPIWAPPEGESAGFHLVNVDRARKAGLTFRPIDTTVTDLLAWFNALPPERQAKRRAGLSPEREAELLRAFHEESKKK
ncbi:NAD-dependent epimerase/dehydratase family protein [Polyangium sp. 15x6]|uniref:NAD-dependent epimerase/dehydratase family protein n=1 Tax=Polyangium sp. 15x6 TaxID=3042687 RepID=UPI00249CDDC6|nr:NAD-dependent epimerase/dehydratase family protein [Polyangium sp. 15x6]MDI3285009.1 NAD-dependent epimerase/dehydratase family protein [Polyangium sp. 15x6]